MNDAPGERGDTALNLVSAKAFLKSAITLVGAVEHLPDRDYSTPSIYLLLSNALEAALKAVAQAHGADERALSEIGDDLGKAWEAVQATSFVAPAGTRPLVRALQEARRGNWLRYVPAPCEIVPLPDLAMSASTLQRIIDAVDHHFGLLGLDGS